MNRIRAKDFDVIEMNDNVLQVRLWGRIFLLQMESPAYERAFLRLVSLLDGLRDTDEIVGLMAAELPADEVRKILDTLRNMSLVEVIEPVPPGVAADASPSEGYLAQHAAVLRVFESSRTKSAASCQRRLFAQEIALVGAGALGDELARRLPEFGFRHVARMPLDVLLGGAAPAAIAVLAARDHDDDALAAANRSCVEQGRTLVPVILDEGTARVGPTVVPGKTACLACLELRARSNIDNQEAYDAFRRFARAKPRPHAEIPAHLTAVATFACHELLRVATGYAQARSHNGVVKIDLWSGEVTRANALKFPRCPVCSARARLPKYDTHAFAAMLAQL